MKTVIVESSYDFVDGGCNACPTIKAENLRIFLEGNQRVLELMDCQSLIQEIAILEGFSYTFKVDMCDEYNEYTQGDLSVRMIEEDGLLHYQSRLGTKAIVNIENQLDKSLPFINQVLQSVFGLETYEVKRETIE